MNRNGRFPAAAARFNLATGFALVASSGHRSSRCRFLRSPCVPTPTQLLMGLGYLHEHGCIHRDIKFENLLLKVAGDLNTVKIVDFGFAKKLYDLRKGIDAAAHHTVCGSPHYVAPELVDDKSSAAGGAAYDSQARARARAGRRQGSTATATAQLQFSPLANAAALTPPTAPAARFPGLCRPICGRSGCCSTASSLAPSLSRLRTSGSSLTRSRSETLRWRARRPRSRRGLSAD